MRALVLCAFAATLASCASISWTGIAEDMQWNNHINWSPDQVPGENDDVTIPSGVVQVTAPTAVNSLQMGTMVQAPANLTIFQSFVIGQGGMIVQGNGNLFINTGASQVIGQVEIGGTLDFVDGTLSGEWTIDERASANLGNANMKGFSACTFLVKGQISLGGVLQLNQSSVITLNSNVAADTNLVIQNLDGTTTNFDASAATFTYSTGQLIIQAPVTLGKFNLQSGNLTILDSLTFQNSLNVPAGSYIEALGNAALNASAGITGQGVVSIGCQTTTIGSSNFNGFLNLIGGPVIFQGESEIAVVTVSGGTAVFMSPVGMTHLSLLNGQTSGVAAATAANLLVWSKGFSLGSMINVNGSATFQASTLTFGNSAGITILAGANGTVTGTFLMTGPPGGPGLTNNGKINALAAFSTQNINIQGAGSIAVVSTFALSTTTFSQAAVELHSGASFTGRNSYVTVGKVANAQGGKVDGVFGSYHFQCPAECDNISTPNSAAPTSAFSFSA